MESEDQQSKKSNFKNEADSEVLKTLDSLNETDVIKESLLFSKIKSLFNEYLLSDLQSMAAFNYIKKSFTCIDKSSDRVRQWVLSKVNNKAPKGFDKMQMGCPDLCPGIEVSPFHDPLKFEFIQTILDNRSVIIEELLALKSIGGNGFQPYKNPNKTSDIKSKDGVGTLANDSGEWNVYYLFLHELKFESNCKQCPETIKIIEKTVPRQYYHAFFSAVTPGTHIISHNGPTNRKLRVHIPLLNVDGSRIRVGDLTKWFKEGEAVVFDDSFNHESWHSGDKTRINLILDFWHPDLSDSEVKFFKMLQQARLKNGRKYLEQFAKMEKELLIENNRENLEKLTEGDNYFELIEKGKEILKNDDWWVG